MQYSNAASSQRAQRLQLQEMHQSQEPRAARLWEAAAVHSALCEAMVSVKLCSGVTLWTHQQHTPEKVSRNFPTTFLSVTRVLVVCFSLTTEHDWKRSELFNYSHML